MTSLPLDTITCSDALDFLRTLPDCSVNCVVTSVPYYGLRDYGTGEWQGGDPDCKHVAGEMRRGKGLASSVASTRGGGKKIADTPDIQYRDECARCGAKRIDRQMGLENSPQEYIQKMVALFREIRRVLRDDGTCWINIGDSYASSSSLQVMQSNKNGVVPNPQDSDAAGLAPKNLMLIPFRLAIALQDDGWIVRSDIIWAKPNPMPESVTDRPTKSHEYVFLLSKCERYFYDQDAIREPQTGNTHSRGNGSSPKEMPLHDGMVKSNHSFYSSMTAYTKVPGGRNKRSVWTVATEPNSFAHFATFPQALIEPMILAGCPKDGIVLDPFMGSGTTALVARRLGRHWIGCDLSSEYVKLANERLAQSDPFQNRDTGRGFTQLSMFSKEPR